MVAYAVQRAQWIIPVMLGIASLRNNRRVEVLRDIDEQVGGLRVKGNPMLIREALSNLFSNSMEAIGENGRIDIWGSRADGQSVVARITDDGVGIPGERISHLFEPFHSTKPDGYGLGLFATRHILEIHEGSVEIESVEGRGPALPSAFPLLNPLRRAWRTISIANSRDGNNIGRVPGVLLHLVPQ